MSDHADDRLARARAQFQQAHHEDPRTVTVAGTVVPKAVDYHRRLEQWLRRLEPEASEALRLAVACQHIRRWAIARSEYPAGPAGYKRWRTRLAMFHGEQAEAVLADVGYGAATIDRVKALLLKKRLGRDPEVQILEDAVCLTFIEGELEDFARDRPREQVLDIIAKTWAKMGSGGRALALEHLQTLPEQASTLVREALERSE